nr:FAD-binding protein [Betaproteobacteria bacterium]
MPPSGCLPIRPRPTPGCLRSKPCCSSHRQGWRYACQHPADKTSKPAFLAQRISIKGSFNMHHQDDPTLASPEPFDVIVLGGGPSGATAAHDLASRGYRVALLDREGRIKPCGGAIPPKLLREFNIPADVMVCKVRGARIVSPKNQVVGMPIEDGFVGMVDRADFDPWLRARAESAGARRFHGSFSHVERHPNSQGDLISLFYRSKFDQSLSVLRARYLIGADGAKSQLAQKEIERSNEGQYVFAYHEILEAPQGNAESGVKPAFYDPTRCEKPFKALPVPMLRLLPCGKTQA